MKKPLSVASPEQHDYRTDAKTSAAPTVSRRLLPLLPLIVVCMAAALHSTPLQQPARALTQAEHRAELERTQRWEHRLQAFRKARARIELNEQLDPGARAVAIRRLAETSFAAEEIPWLEEAEQIAWARSGGNR